MEANALCYTNACEPLLVQALYAQAQFIVYIVFVIVAALCVYVFSVCASHIKHARGPWSPQYLRVRKLHTFSYPTLSGLLGAQSIIFAKALAELMKSSAAEGSGSAFASPLFYGILFVLVLSIGNQLHWIATALKIAPALLVVPVFQSVFIVTAIVGGAALFNEMAHLTAGNLATFLIGLALMLLGIFILAARDDGARPPSRFYVASLAIRALIRARRQIRLRLSATQPDRLRLHSCACACHAAFTEGSDDRPAAKYALSTRKLLISRAAALVPQDGAVHALGASPERQTSVPASVSHAVTGSTGVHFASGGGRGEAASDSETLMLTRQGSSDAGSSLPRVAIKPAVGVLGVRFWKDARGQAKHTIGWGVGVDSSDSGAASPGAASPSSETPNALVGSSGCAVAPADLPEGACPACFCCFPPFEAVELRLELDRARAAAEASTVARPGATAPPQSGKRAGPAAVAVAETASPSKAMQRWASTRRIIAAENWGYYSDRNPAVPSYLAELLPTRGSTAVPARPFRSASEGGGHALPVLAEGVDEDLQEARPPEALGARLSRLAGSAEASIRDLLGFAPPPSGGFATRATTAPGGNAHLEVQRRTISEGLSPNPYENGASGIETAGARVQRAHTTDLSFSPGERSGARLGVRPGADRRGSSRRISGGSSSGMPLPASVIIGAGLHGLSIVAIAAAKRYAASVRRERSQGQPQQPPDSAGDASESFGDTKLTSQAAGDSEPAV